MGISGAISVLFAGSTVSNCHKLSVKENLSIHAGEVPFPLNNEIINIGKINGQSGFVSSVEVQN